MAASVAPNPKNRLPHSVRAGDPDAAAMRRRDFSGFLHRKDCFDDHDRDPEEQEQDCCMCGDVGFSSELFRCSKCFYRFQHTYCSRFYPSNPNQDVCDWCSQDLNPSVGSSTATPSSSRSRGLKPNPAIALGGAGGSSGSKRKATTAIGESLEKQAVGSNCSTRDASDHHHHPRIKVTNSSTSEMDRNESSSSDPAAVEKLATSSVISRSGSLIKRHRDALELLLEVAQTVAADGQANHRHQALVRGSSSKNLKLQCGQEQQQQQQQRQRDESGINGSHSGARVAVAATTTTTSSSSLLPKRQKFVGAAGAARADHHHAHDHGNHDHRQRQQPPQQQQQQQRDDHHRHHSLSGLIKGHGRKEKLQHLTSSRSIGRRYKLLSDVMC